MPILNPFTARNPEDPARLEALSPPRRYTRFEVVQVMTLLAGLVNDGYLVAQWSLREEPRWFVVEVEYDSYLSSANDTETWYFYKAEVAP